MRIERTELAQQQYDLALFASEVEAGAHNVYCSETMVPTPTESRHVAAINTNLGRWLNFYERQQRALARRGFRE